MSFLEETDSKIIRNIRDPEDFISDSFEGISMGVGILFIAGRLKDINLAQELINPDQKAVQSIEFSKPDWDKEEALEWLRENQRYLKADDLKKFSQLKSIQGVDVFAAGTWNGDKYTTKDLDEMVRAFNENKDAVRPYLKLGHDDEQKLLQKEGLPAAGWVEKLYRVGDKLKADFVDIPDKIYDLIIKKAYRKVSSEILVGVKILENSYQYMISGIALLGSETPGVMVLDDILSMYNLADNKIKDYSAIRSYSGLEKKEIKEYEFKNEEAKEMAKTEKEIELEALLKSKEDELKKLSASLQDVEKSKQDALDEAKKALEDVQKFSAKLADQEIESQVDKLENEKLITKGMRPFVQALLKPEKKEYSIEGKEKSLNKYELVYEIAKLFSEAAGVNFDNSSKVDKKEGEKITEKEILEEVEKYSAENKVSFRDAYSIIGEKYKTYFDMRDEEDAE